MARIASATGRPWDNSTSTCRSFATISSGLCFFCGIAGILQRLKKPTSGRATFQGAGQEHGLEYTAMRAVEALKAARAAGVELALDGEDLVLEAVLAPQAAVLDALSQH